MTASAMRKCFDALQLSTPRCTCCRRSFFCSKGSEFVSEVAGSGVANVEKCGFVIIGSYYYDCDSCYSYCYYYDDFCDYDRDHYYDCEYYIAAITTTTITIIPHPTT